MNIEFKKITATVLSLLMCAGVVSAREAKVETYTPTTTDGELIVEKDGVIPISFTIDIPARMMSVDDARVYRPYLSNGSWRKDLPTILVEGINYKSAKADEVRFGDLSGKAEPGVYGSTYQIPLCKALFTGVSIPYECVIDAEALACGALLIVEGETMTIRRYEGNWMCRKEPQPDIRLDTLNAKNPYQTVKSTYNSTYGGGDDFMDINPKMYLYSSVRNKVLASDFGSKSVFFIQKCEVDQDVFALPFEDFVNQVSNLKGEDAVLDSVVVNVASSPDGPLYLNKKLAACRTRLIQKLVAASLPDFTAENTVYHTIDENWCAFVDVVKERANIYSVVESIIAEQPNLDARERELLATDFRRDIIDIFKELRTCDIKAYFSKPVVMSSKKCSDMYVVGVKCSEDVPFNIIDEDITDRSTLETLNNAMVAATLRGDYKKAFEYYKVLAKDYADNEYTINNLAVLLSYIGDYPMAEYYFVKAPNLKSTNSNLAQMYIMAGQYDRAMETYGDCKCKNAVALKLAHGQYEEVIELTKDSEYKDGDMLYIRALAYSHVKNNDLTLFTLEQACDVDPENKARAKSQPEFADLYDCDAFKAIVK